MTTEFCMSPEELIGLAEDLKRKDLQVLTCVVMAQRDLEAGNFQVAAHRLNNDADKFSCCSFGEQRLNFIELAIARYRSFRSALHIVPSQQSA
ncbi:hypothetical protein RYA05_01025 [Pseudomonas syringae pv. actinidiae]|nr:hypothetical protein [Pseudomonas syringae pv. actinidiae]